MSFSWKRGATGLGWGSRVQALARANTTLWCALFLLGASSLAHEAACPMECRCPEPLSCRPGVSLVLDDCGCCRVCARQFNEVCSALQPCERRLDCQQAAGNISRVGICRANTPGRSCVKNGKVYQHGETFRPSCRLQCICEDGRFGCLALCPLHLPAPPASCPDAHLVQEAGTCCKKWECSRSSSKERTLKVGKWKEKFDSINEVVERRVANKRMRGPSKAWRSGSPGCQLKSTEWSGCSKTCDIGISTRLTTNNTKCRLREEFRLCQIRPCSMLSDLALSPKEGSGCLKTHKEKVAQPFVYEGCSSLKRYKPKYCGLCRDGRCCQPSETRTTKVRFNCPGVGTLVKLVAKIMRCECARPRRQTRGCFQAPQVSYNWKRSLQDLVDPEPDI